MDKELGPTAEPISAGEDPRARLVRILVVDDYEPFRRFTRSTLEGRLDFQIVGEAADGLEAVRKAGQLQPDLIVLDIGLPLLNGIAAARKIRKLCPDSKILFLSQESSANVAREALSLGAIGYLVKTHAGGELLAAVEAVSQGRQFVSRGVSGNDNTRDVHVRNEASTSPARRTVATDRNHAVKFYSDDASFVIGFARFIEIGLDAGNTVVVVATESHRNSFFQRLQARGLNISAAIEQGRYIPLDVADTLSSFMVNDVPDTARFLKVAGNLITAASKSLNGGSPRIAACGECAPVLWAEGKANAAVQVEHLWDEIARTCNIDILCGYVLNGFQRAHESPVYERICAEHSLVCSQ